MNRKQPNYRATLLAVGLLLTAAWVAARASADAPAPAGSSSASVPSTVPTTFIGSLWADDFWTTTGNSADHPQDEATLTELRRLSVAADRPAVRLRAIKLLCDLKGNSRFAAGMKKDDAAQAVAVAFSWLEGHLADPEVAKYAPEAGFTHMTLSRMSDDNRGIWVLIETSALPPAFNGGLNIRFDPKTGTVTKVKQWGSVRAK